MKKTMNFIIAITILSSAFFIVFPMNIYSFVMLQSLAVHGLLFYGLFLIIAVLYKSWINVISGSLSLFIVLIFLWPHLHFSTPNTCHRKGNISIAHFNVLLFNNDFQSTIDASLNSKADLISFQEVNQEWCDSLTSGLNKLYPFQLHLPDDITPFGLTIFSKHPILNQHYTFIKTKPIAELDIQYHGKSIHVIATHTNSPVSYHSFKTRNLILTELKKKIKNINYPTFILGDLNVVPWDYNFTQIVNLNKVKDSRTSYSGTYPAWSPIGKIPIDYILHSNEFECTQFDVIDGTSSDHLGVLGSYHFKPNIDVAEK